MCKHGQTEAHEVDESHAPAVRTLRPNRRNAACDHSGWPDENPCHDLRQETRVSVITRK